MSHENRLSTDIDLLIDGIDSLDSGVTVFDSRLRLVTANRRFIEMLGFPSTLMVPGTSLAAMFRFNAERGEYGDGDIEALVEERMAQARRFEPHRFERLRPDGTILEVRGSPLRSGGFITIYIDVTTERQRERSLAELSSQLERRVEERTAELRQREEELARKSHQLELVVSHIRHGISVFGPQMTLELCNDQFLEIMRLPREFACPGRPFADFIRFNAVRGDYGPCNVEETVAQRVEQARHPTLHQFERTRPDGTSIEIIGSPLPDGGFVTTYIDITERKHAEAQRDASEANLLAMLEASPIGVALIDQADMTIRFCNKRLAELAGAPADSLIGNTASGFCRMLLEEIDLDTTVLNLERSMVRADGSHWHCLISARTITSKDRPALLLWVYDITELYLARRALRHIAHHDGLTDIPNRRHFESFVAQALARAERRRSRGALLFIDLDGFKRVNDSFGHQTGDRLLKTIAAGLRERMRKSDFVARLGGDEFAVICEDCGADGGPLALASELVTMVRELAETSVPGCGVGASIGLAYFDSDGPDRDQLMRNADMAMYRAKTTGHITEHTDAPAPPSHSARPAT